MKKPVYLTIILLIYFCISNLFGQQNLFLDSGNQMYTKNSDNALSPSVWKGQIGGFILPSTGTVNVLIIFSQFPDDNFDTTNALWPKGSDPIDKNDWISKTWTGNPTQGSLTHYFNEMSFNKFKFIGKIFSLLSPHTRQWYLDNGWKRGDIQKEIILQVNKTMDFAEFDNWNWVDDYQQINEPDNRIDLIIFIWRNIAEDLPNADSIKDKLDFSNDIANLGAFHLKGTSTNYVFTVDGGLRRVCTNYAGITVRNYLPDRNKAFRITVHEIGHYLLGGTNYHNGFGFWGMLSSYGVKSIVANSFERSRLGWIKLKTIQGDRLVQTIHDAKLSDYVTTGDAYCYEIDSASGQYFYLENHQNISYWETAFKLGNIEKGLYVIRKDNLTPSNQYDSPPSAYMSLIPADGRFDWTVNQTVVNPWGLVPPGLPVFKKLKPDKVNGYHDLEPIPWIWNGISQKPIPIYFTEDQNGKAQLDVRYPGDGNDAFRIGYNEVFTPWSNPNSYNAERTPTPFGFKIDSLVNGVYSIDIYVNNSVDAPPSKPIGLILNIDSINSAVKLVWQPNIEPDLSSYEISRNTGHGWKVIATTTDTSYTDNSILNIYSKDTLTPNYRVRAKDTQNLYSVFSDIKSIYAEPNYKISNVAKSKMDSEYKLVQNYPNPFNPITTIKYSIPKASFVTLKVYDILGREVATLVNEEKPLGNYQVEFNASSLASGVYFYKIQAAPVGGQAGNFAAVKKLLLLK